MGTFTKEEAVNVYMKSKHNLSLKKSNLWLTVPKGARAVS
jgi:hypothetical protein